MKTMILSAITASTLLAGVCAHASPTYYYQQSASLENALGKPSGGANFVRVSGQSGYYVVAPGSNAIDALGLQNAPYRDAANIARNSMGSDAIAFRFDSAGRLEGHPVYISAQPESFYTSRLAALANHRTTLADVRAVFDSRDVRVEKRGADTLAYLEVPVYDPLASGD